MGNAESQPAVASEGAEAPTPEEVERLAALCARLNLLGARLVAEHDRSSEAGAGGANTFFSPLSLTTAINCRDF